MKLKSLIIVILMLSILPSCSKDKKSGTGGGASIVGLDLSGVWRFVGVICYDSQLESATAIGVPDESSSAGTIIIDGNTMSSQSVSNSCSVSSTRSIVANLNPEIDLEGYGTGTFGETTMTLSSGSSCTLITNLFMDQDLGSVTPNPFSVTYGQGESVAAQEFEFVYEPPYLSITSVQQVVGRPTDVCSLVYEKL